MKRRLALGLLLCVALLLILYAVFSPSKEDALRLYNEARALQEKPRSDEDLKQAAQKFEEAIRIFHRVGEQEEAGRAYNNVGLIYADLGQYQKAVEHYEKALDLSRKVGDVETEAQNLTYLGQVYLAWGQHERALANFRQALAIYEKIGVPTARSKGYIAGTYLDLGDLRKADPWVKEANLNEAWGRFYLLEGEYAKAKEQYQAVLQWGEKSRNVDSLFTGYTGMGLSCEGMDDNEAALQHFEKAVHLIEDLREGLSHAEKETFLEVRVNGLFRRAPYEGLARVMTKMKRPLDASK